MFNSTTDLPVSHEDVQRASIVWQEALIQYGAGLIGSEQYRAIRRAAYAVIRRAEDAADAAAS
jgi:hypothetical protein